jgi:hypothetical protein
MTVIKSEISSVKTRVQNTEKLSTLQDSRIRIQEREAWRKKLVIYGLQEIKADISFKKELAHYLARRVPQINISQFTGCFQIAIKIGTTSYTCSVFQCVSKWHYFAQWESFWTGMNVCDSGLFAWRTRD